MNHQFSGIVVIKFPKNNKSYTFGSNDETLVEKDKVVVETSRGMELGTVSKSYESIETFTGDLELKPVVRKATEYDLESYKSNKVRAFDAKAPIEKVINSEQLDMKVVEVEYTLDRSKLIITYVADERVDFRNLLKQLTSQFNCRIELKQIGQRDKARCVGGLGVCGRELCCKGVLKDFDVVSINLAKNQMLSLNIGKLSGQCDKLKCCLRYENAQYSESKVGLPKLHANIEFMKKRYHVQEINVISRQMTLTTKDERLLISIDEYLKEKNNV